MIRRQVTILSMVSAVILLTGCPQKTMIDQFNAKLDPNLTSRERRYLLEDAKRTAGLRLNVTPDSTFAKIFGGPDANAILRYLDERVNYLVSKNTDINSHIVQIQETLNAGGSTVVASNIGMALWLVREAVMPDQDIGFLVGKETVPLNHSRNGVIRLGEGYTKINFLVPLIPAFERIFTMVHEARHSDCTGGLPVSDVIRVRNNLQPLQRHCGHMHSLCPTGHALEGYFACDDLAWGAYAVHGVFASAVSAQCTNCSNKEKSIARAAATEAFSRVIYLDEMLNGEWGDPDMSSSGVFKD